MKNMAANGAAAIAIFIFCIMGVATSVEVKKEGEASLMVYICISEHVVVFSCEFQKKALFLMHALVTAYEKTMIHYVHIAIQIVMI